MPLGDFGGGVAFEALLDESALIGGKIGGEFLEAFAGVAGLLGQVVGHIEGQLLGRWQAVAPVGIEDGAHLPAYPDRLRQRAAVAVEVEPQTQQGLLRQVVAEGLVATGLTQAEPSYQRRVATHQASVEGIYPFLFVELHFSCKSSTFHLYNTHFFAKIGTGW